MFREQELLLAQEAAGLAIWEWVAEKDEFRWLPGSVPLFGVPVEQLRKQADVMRHVLPEDLERIVRESDEAIREGHDFVSEYRVRWPNGDVHWLRARGRPVFHPERGALLIGVTQDITESKAREATLRAQARLLELAHEPILVRDARDRITFWNNGAQRLYGYTWQEAIGRNSHELLRTEFPQPLQTVLSELTTTGFWQGEIVHCTKEGRRLHVSSRWQRLVLDGKYEASTLETNFELTAQKVLQAAQAWEQKAEL